MNTQSYVAKQNEEQAKALYDKERSKTKSEQYLDYFTKWNERIDATIAKVNACVTTYEKTGGLEEQTKFIVPHAKLLKAHSVVLTAFIEALKDNIAKDPTGSSNAPILKMRNIDDLDLIFEGLATEIKFIEKIFAGVFDTRTMAQNIDTSDTQSKPFTAALSSVFEKKR